jgi:hypothetical protein
VTRSRIDRLVQASLRPITSFAQRVTAVSVKRGLSATSRGHAGCDEEGFVWAMPDGKRDAVDASLDRTYEWSYRPLDPRVAGCPRRTLKRLPWLIRCRDLNQTALLPGGLGVANDGRDPWSSDYALMIRRCQQCRAASRRSVSSRTAFSLSALVPIEVRDVTVHPSQPPLMHLAAAVRAHCFIRCIRPSNDQLSICLCFSHRRFAPGQ